eukprot:6200299-Pleurochrysis_carterae.AAC.1
MHSSRAADFYSSCAVCFHLELSRSHCASVKQYATGGQVEPSSSGVSAGCPVLLPADAVSHSCTLLRLSATATTDKRNHGWVDAHLELFCDFV